MGFSVPRFELGKEHRDEAGQDFVPPDRGYKPTINVHGNHSNLDHYYDPRTDLPDTYVIEDAEKTIGERRRNIVVPVTVVLLIILFALVISLPLLIR